jgi:hypothetical protein
MGYPERQIEQEKDYIILKSIARFGYLAIPMNYDFLERYSLKNLYIDIVNGKTSMRPTIHLEIAAKSQAAISISSSICNLSAFREYREKFGDRKTRELLGDKIYWKEFLNLLRHLR